ncbi:hypothetical protein ASU31_21895 [Pedobacter ginsenosidimutans]|uniref:Uncharacterized protein n=1 Tax=Pedobacter ginsenosidimutans TaxID=687842 RepID=A0A0T5VJN6_9SPHI|nr:hypothetical protein [Pedobacter ginsenosidimutans]KRT13913.1 hypothetical protein ASU31_21895 [Pedobacter ginsenosidimutans]
MKSKLKLPIKQMGAAALLVSMTFTGCKKDETKIEPAIQTKKISEAEFSKLLQYISITTNAPKDQILFDEKKQEFVVYGWFHKSLTNAQSEHDSANEYIATYEK